MMKNLSLISWLTFLFIAILLVINGCDGGGSSSNSNYPESTGTISGSVSGTTILVLDDDGMIIVSDNTKRRIPDLDRDGDGIKESYSFTVNGVPVGKRVRIYLVTNENVFPMYFDNNGTAENVLSLSYATDIELGFVGSSGGEAIPEKNPLSAPDVVPEGADTKRINISGAEKQDYVGIWRGQVWYYMNGEDDCPEDKCSDEDDHDPCDPEEGYANIEFSIELLENGQLDATMHELDEGWTAGVFASVFEEDTATYTFHIENPYVNPEEYEQDIIDDCKSWDVKFTATLKEDSNGELNIMDLTGGGLTTGTGGKTFCGCGGGTTGSFSDEIKRCKNCS